MHAGSGARVEMAKAMVALHRRKVVNLVDDESSEDEIKSPTKKPAEVADMEGEAKGAVGGVEAKDAAEEGLDGAQNSRSPTPEVVASEDLVLRGYDPNWVRVILLPQYALFSLVRS